MSTLTEFVLARNAERESVARAADGELVGHMLVDDFGTITTDDGVGIAGYAGECLATHIVAWQPTRVLAWCETVRRIVALRPAQITTGGGEVLSLMSPEELEAVNAHRRMVLVYLALPDAGHPEYDPAWAV